MTKVSLKTFFKNLLYIFVPMGIIFLFAVIAIYSFADSTVGEVKGLIADVGEATQTVLTPDTEEIVDYFSGEIAKINWDQNIFRVIKEIISTNWLGNTLHGFFDYLKVNYQAFADEIVGLVDHTVGRIKMHLNVAFSILITGIVLSYFVCRLIVRHHSARRNFWKFPVAYFAESVVGAGIIYLCAWLMSLWTFSVFFSSLLFFLLFGFVSLLGAWLVQNDRVVPFRAIVNVKNVVGLYLGDVIILAIAILFLYLVKLATGGFFCFLLALPTVIYAIVVISVNAEAYVAECARRSAALPPNTAA